MIRSWSSNVVAGRVAAGAGVVEDAEPGREPLGLLDPVEDERARDDDQRRPLRLPSGAAALEVGEHLHGLAQAHVVGEDAAELELLEVVEPAEPLALIRAQLAAEAGGGLAGDEAVELGQGLADLAEGHVDLDLRLRREQGVEQPGLGPAEADAALLGGAEVGEQAVFLQPLLGEHPHRAVAQLDHRLAAAGGGEQVGQGDALAAEVDGAAELEPVDPGRDGQLELAGRVDDRPLGLDLPAERDQLLRHPRQPLRRQFERAGGEEVVLRLAEAHLEELHRGVGLGRLVAVDDDALLGRAPGAPVPEGGDGDAPGLAVGLARCR